ncbi:hypothetical protein, partial [Klebsiella pneumoniae]|uniref:hypothetical protein n=1 Tax=Klebsiella pneumoniae TaxID=573 RepID=UPI0027316A34
DGLISPDADALPAKRSLKALLDRVKTMLRPAPSHKLLDAVAQRLNTPKTKAGENLEARHARFTDILSTLERYQDYTADQLNAEFKKK